MFIRPDAASRPSPTGRRPAGRGLRSAATLLLALCAACSRNDPGSEPLLRETAPAIQADGRVLLRRGNGTEPETLDPHRAQSTTSSTILRDLYEGLIAEDAAGKLVPGVAERWERSADGLEYVFHLRHDARWSNGAALTAADFVYGLRRAVDPKTASVYAEMLAPLANAREIVAGRQPPETLGVAALDPYTLQIRLQAPTPYLLGLLAHSIAYPAYRPAVEQHGDGFTAPGRHVSNGAYVLREWVVSSHVLLARNPHYWDNARTRIGLVKYLAIDNSESEFKRYLAGELDMTADVPLPQLEWVRRHLPGEFRVHPSNSTYYYGLNLERPPFRDNPKLRRALSMALYREGITQKVLRGGEIPAYGWIPPGIADYSQQRPDWADWPRARQLAEARRLYREAGYSADNPLELELRYNTSEGHKKIATVVAAIWKQELGVRTTLINEEWKVLLQNVTAKKLTQAYRAGWVGDYNDANTFAELMHSAFGLNGTGYASPRYDALVEGAAREPDTTRRRALLEEAERVLLEDQPLIPVYFYVNKRLVKPYVQGYQGNIMNHHRSQDLWIEWPGVAR